MESKHRNTWIVVILLLLVVVACCCAVAAVTAAGFWALDRYAGVDLRWGPVVDREETSGERVEQSFAVGAAPRLDITNYAGVVLVQSGPDGAISVAATKKARTWSNLEDIELTMTQSGDQVTIKTRTKPRINNTSVELEITVPAGTRLAVDQGAGEIEVNGLAAPVRVSTGAGNIVVRDVAGEIDVQCGAGVVNVQEASGPVRVDVGAGDLRYEGNPAGDCRFHTGAGLVTLRLPVDLNMKVDLGCGMGEVRADYPVQGQVKAREVKGVIGDGSQGSITAYSALGSVNLTPR